MSLGSTLVVAGIALVGVAMISPSLKSGGSWSSPTAERPFAASVSPARLAQPGGANVGRALIRGSDGHFYADAQVNGVTIRFMIDTGASVVMLTQDDARRAGIPLPAERTLAMGVGGTVSVAPVTIGRIAVGAVEARSIQAAVADELPVSLLGQNFLARFGSVEIRGDTMVLR
ncbi:MAG TPA: TIGR02281 family clan AA aspartic protease [Allosphingosinicella sp.]|nr:TIGR02281 family clan AA aspartic protease [Allosphingosinicella sp.]